MEESILRATKKVLNIGLDDDSFDLDITTHINSAFSNLHQLGIGPVDGFAIDDEEAEWADFGISSTPMLSLLKTCIYLRVRLLFDPPTTSYLRDASEAQVREHEWRLSTLREATDWVDPDPPGPPTMEEFYDYR
jgi:hypothetical protein